MTKQGEIILGQVMQLSDSDQQELLDRLSVKLVPDTLLSSSEKKEVARRIARLDQGKTKTGNWDQLINDLEKEYST